jgi:hypothetical protein
VLIAYVEMENFDSLSLSDEAERDMSRIDKARALLSYVKSDGK